MIVQSIDDFYNKKNYNAFYSHSDFLKKYVLFNEKNETNESIGVNKSDFTEDANEKIEYDSDLEDLIESNV